MSDQAAVRVLADQLDPGQVTGHQAPKNANQPGIALGRGHLGGSPRVGCDAPINLWALRSYTTLQDSTAISKRRPGASAHVAACGRTDGANEVCVPVLEGVCLANRATFRGRTASVAGAELRSGVAAWTCRTLSGGIAAGV